MLVKTILAVAFCAAAYPASGLAQALTSLTVDGIPDIGAAHSARKTIPERIVISGFQTPESVVHDTALDLYLVSNVGPLPPGGFPGALDHNGFISRVSPHGVILQLKWIEDGVN